MDKVQLDELYHNLRELCITDDILQKEAVAGIISHLTEPRGNYVGLLRFLNYYGDQYILPHIFKLLQSCVQMPKFSRVVELGSGFGWLGRGISNTFNVPPVFVDKRQWVFTDIVADIETKQGVKRVLDELREGDLIVLAELLHCIENPRKVLEPFRKWPMLVIEYWPENNSYRNSYNAQIAHLDCEPIKGIRDVFPGSKIIPNMMDTHGIWLILPL